MSRYSNEELIEQFIKSAVETTATVEKIPCTPEDLNSALLRETIEDDYVMFTRPVHLDAGLFLLFENNEKVILKPTNEQLRTIKTGITEAFCGIAKTGSVCVAVENDLSSSMSMLTRKHIAVVDGNTIVSRPSDVFNENNLDGKGLNRSFTFITGPSATADMGPLVRGVHGPGKLHIIILE